MMDDIYEQLKTIDYILLCVLYKYRLIHKYTKFISDIFINTINEYKIIINKIQQTYKQNIYDSLKKKYSEFKENSEILQEQAKKITEIKENLKKASKLTNTNIKIKENDEKKSYELNKNLKINFPYSVEALYKLRYYRNAFIKNYKNIIKNDNYLNACEQRKVFFEKLMLSAKTLNGENKNKGIGIYKDEEKKVTQILHENYFFKESQQLKEMLIISKCLNKAKNIINNIPQFLYMVIEELELTESQFNENMYLFILLALNKWIKNIILECEKYILLRQIPQQKQKQKQISSRKEQQEQDIYKKYNEYMNDILQRGVEHTNIQYIEQMIFYYPPNLNFNINTSFLTYCFLYINKNLFDFLKGYYIGGSGSNSSKKKKNINEGKKIKMIMLNKKEDSVYMKNDIYNNKFYNEYKEIDFKEMLGFKIEQEVVCPNIFLICNYLLQKETHKIINEIYKLQKNNFHLMFFQDISIIIQILISLIKNIKRVLKKNIEEVETKKKKYVNDEEHNNVEEGEEEKEENKEEESVEENEEDERIDNLHKYISKAYLNYNCFVNYKKFLGPLRKMILNLLKFIHVIIKCTNKNTICSFWQRMNIRDDISENDVEHFEEEKTDVEEKKKEEMTKNYNVIRNYENEFFQEIKKECNETNCYIFKKKEESPNDIPEYTRIVNIKESINKRALCYDFYKMVADQMEKTKFEIENKKNRDVFTGILKKKKYKLESTKTKDKAKANKSTPTVISADNGVLKDTSYSVGTSKTSVKEIKKSALQNRVSLVKSKNEKKMLIKRDMRKESIDLKTTCVSDKMKNDSRNLLKGQKGITNITEKKGNAKYVRSKTENKGDVASNSAKEANRNTSFVNVRIEEKSKNEESEKTIEDKFKRVGSSLASAKRNVKKV